jgi:hypothetical protein
MNDTKSKIYNIFIYTDKIIVYSWSLHDYYSINKPIGFTSIYGTILILVPS